MIRWLVSYPKSGNTWLRFFLTAYRDGGAFADFAGTLGLIDLNPYFFQVVSPKPVPDLTDFEAFALRPAALLHMIIAAGGSIYVKSHNAHCRIYQIPLFPQHLVGKCVYVVRDPRDVACSYADHTGKTLDEAITAMGNELSVLRRKNEGHPAFLHVLGTWSQHVKSWQRDAHQIRYEDLQTDPVDTFSGVLDYLEIEVDRARVERSVEFTSFDRLARMEQDHGFDEKSPHSEKFFRRGVVGGWRDTLSTEQVAKLEEDHGAVMQEYGYELSHARLPV